MPLDKFAPFDVLPPPKPLKPGIATVIRDNLKRIADNTAAPVAQFTGSPTSGVEPLTVNFSSTSTGSITSYQWNFGDGATDTVAAPSHVYAAGGPYTVSLTVTGPGGSNTQTRSNYVAASAAAPVAQFTGSPTSGVEPLTVNFSSTSTGSITSYQWNYGDGATDTVAAPSHVYAAGGPYTVSLTVTGPGGSNTQTRSNYVTASGAAHPPLPTPEAFRIIAVLGQVRDPLLDQKSATLATVNRQLTAARGAKSVTDAEARLALQDAWLAKSFAEQFRDLTGAGFDAERCARLGELMAFENQLAQRVK